MGGQHVIPEVELEYGIRKFADRYNNNYSKYTGTVFVHLSK